MRRWISLVVALAMFAPAAASAAEGAMATWLSPQPGQIVSGGKVEVAIGYNTQSKVKVSSIELYVDGQFLTRKDLRTPETRGVCSFDWNTKGVEQGTHNLVVKVFAGEQMISKIYGTGTVGPNGTSRGLMDVRPPIVTFSNIKAGDVLKGTSTIKMNAADDSGQSPMVSLLVDDVLKLLKNTPPYTYDLDTTTYTDGDHALKTYAYDGAGNRSDPAVVKVAFRNGAEKPVVTTLSVNRESAPEEVAEAKLSQATPPSVSVSAEPRMRASASRAETRIDASSTPVAPVVAVAQPKPKMVAMAPKPAVSVKTSIAAPKLAEKLRPIPVATSQEIKTATVAPKADGRIAAAVKPDIKIAPAPAKKTSLLLGTGIMPSKMQAIVRANSAKPAMSAPPAAAKPAVVDGPRASGIRAASAVRLPEARQATVSAPAAVGANRAAVPVVKTAKSAEPKQALSAAKPSGLTRMAMAPAASSIRSAAGSAVSVSAVADSPSIVDRPVASSVKNVPVEQSAASLKSAEIASGVASAVSAAKPAVASQPTVSKSDLKRVRVAMAPDLRSAAERSCPSPAISCPPSVPKCSKARIEKTTAPAAKGKVKARDFLEKMGAVLFWDPSTHTVTACMDGMVLEIKIGSRIATVNGHEFEMAVAPFLVNDRTVFEAGTLARACALLDGLRTVGKAVTN